MKLVTAHAAVVRKCTITISVKSGCNGLFARNGFALSAFRFDKIVDCILHAYYINLLFNGPSVTIFKVKIGENICSYVMRCEIWYQLCNLKKHEKRPWSSVTFSKALVTFTFSLQLY